MVLGIGGIDLDVLVLRHSHLMGVTQVHHQVLALLLHTVTDALHFQGLGKAFGNAHHHVVHQGAGQPVEGAGLLLVVGAGSLQSRCLPPQCSSWG